mmetsp:Transcript_7344/g.15112  ORF Transcript_7344/g.15112 Transcript_7344/m.15112 type:complete len:218 (+) Transcript_7344:203-856(+)
MVSLARFLLLLQLLPVGSVRAWGSSPKLSARPAPQTRPGHRRDTATVLEATTDENSSSSSSSSTDNKDDEIAKLEEQLRKLRDERSTGGGGGEEASTVAAASGTAIAAEDKAADDDEEMPEEEASMDMFLSEGWKEARSSYDPGNTSTQTRRTEERGNLVGTVAKVAGAILALVLFSQIPVGQEDLSKYSAIKSGPAATSIDLGDINRVKGRGGSDL